jgi:hypothetical protein
MNNTIKNILACCYFGLVIIGLFGIMNKIIFFSLLIIFTIGLMAVLRKEEDEEFRDNQKRI